MQNYTKTELGTLAGIISRENGKAFLKEELQLTSCEISVNVLPAGAKLPFSHTHKQNEEVYLFLKGFGMMILDGTQIEVQEGTCIRVLPQTARTLEAKTDMQYICIQAKADSLEQWGLADALVC